MAWLTPKLDWLPTDSINAADFNRIENNTAEVAAYLNSISYSIPSLTTNTGRTKTSIDFLADINRIEQNLETVRAHFLTPPGYQGAETWTQGKGFDNADAIRLEQNVKLLMEYGLLVYQSFLYCGATICGDTGVIYVGI
ncbi:hypothetical protein [Paenibacillus cymbidii]|uniref:hypothetical protein n=1 Tax=Paenibacillus cymbidii TaxID=1639034 RepID=UPI0010802F91|nr:hypothetical protein [Paenibacillus cymbidii]